MSNKPFLPDIYRKLPKISIVGAGCVGSALGQLAYKTGYRISAVSDIDPMRAKELGKLVNTKPLDAPDACIAGELVLLTVPDDNISPLCETLTKCGAFEHKPVVAHSSGALGSDVLLAAEKVGCPTGSMHPLQTFPDAQTAMKSIPGTYFFIEGSKSGVAVLWELANSLGANPVNITLHAKTLYHAAAVIASNYFVTLMDTASGLMEAAGVTDNKSLDALEPLVRTTLENIFNKDAESLENTGHIKNALTGPIARGDIRTVRGHLQELAGGSPEILQLYKATGLCTVSLAEKKGTIDAIQAERFRVLLGRSPHS